MKIITPALIFATVACMTLALPAAAQHEAMSATPPTKSAKAAKAVNAMCPIGKEAIDPNTPTAMYKGNEIGFCCGGCNEEFMAWDEDARDKFVVLAVAHSEPGNEAGAATKADPQERVGDPYMLTTCAVAGGPLGGMGDPVVMVYEGREVRFCCAMCVPKFEKDLAASFEKVDAKIIASQLPYYPLTTCVVSGEDLSGSDMESTDVVFNNRLVRLCCKRCVKALNKNPEAYLKKIDEAVIAQQRDSYPLDYCPMMDDPLEEGEIVEFVMGNRLFRLCCKMCKRKFKKDPTAAMAALDEAWAAQGGVQR